MQDFLGWLQSADGRLTVKLGVAAAGALLVALLALQARRGGGSRLLSALLALTTLVGVAGYFEFGALRYERYLNPHDVYHYYLGSKYSLEHRYLDLYRASLLADLETNAERGQEPVFRETSIRDLRTHRYEKLSVVMEQTDALHEQFGATRWAQFKADTRFFQDAVTPYSRTKWTEMLRDKGYNATPVWNAVARALSWRIPVTDARLVQLLPAFDLALLVGMFALVFRAFGAQTGAITLLFYSVSYMMAYPHIKGGFLRLDWVACTVAAGALLKLGRPVLAGAALAYATLARVFPVIFALGPAVLLAENLIAVARARGAATAPPLRRDLLAFFASASLFGAALIGASILADGGTDLWAIFLDKIALHNQDMSSNRAGFKYLYYGLATGLRFNEGGLFDDPPLLYTALALGSLVPTVLALRRRLAWEALFISFVPVYFLTAPTFYYFVILVAPFLYLASRPASSWHALGAIGLFAVSVLAYALDFDLPHGYGLFFAISAALLPVCALILLAAWRTPAEEPPPVPRAARSGAEAAVVVLVALGLGGLMLSAPEREVERPLVLSEPVAPGPGEISLAFVGDVMFSRNVERDTRRAGRSWDALFDASRALLSEADLAVANLETPVSERGAVIDKRYTFRSPPDALPALARSGIDIVSLANNHTLDYGPEALDDTERLLAEHGLRFGGVARAGEPQDPLILEVGGLRVGMLFYCDPEPTYSCAEEFRAYERRPVEATPETVARDLGALRPKVDLLVVVIHWGVEYREEPTRQTRSFGRTLVELGADIVAGSHPHVQHPVERYKDGLILYSLGNFVFDQRSRPATRVSRIVRVVAGADGVRAVQLVPMEIVTELWGPRPLTPGFLDLAQDRYSLRALAIEPEIAR